MIEGNFELKERPTKSKGEARISLMRGLWEDAKNTYLEVSTKRKEEGLDKESQERQKRKVMLSLLIAAEFIPVAEMSNEGAKAVSTSEKLIKNIKETAPEAIDAAKSKGLIGDLYPNVPDWLVSSMGVLDAAGVPFIGIIPDVIQYVYDQAMEGKDIAGTSKEAVSVFKQKREERREQINQAALAFSG